MKKILIGIQFAVILCTVVSYASSPSKALLICNQDVQVLNIKDGSFIGIKSNINVVQFYVVDTVVYLVGYTGEKRQDIHRYFKLKTNMWSMSLPQMLQNKAIDTLQLKFESESTSNEIKMLATIANNKSSAWFDAEAYGSLKFRINKKLDSFNVSKDPRYIGKIYTYLEPVVFIERVSNIYQRKCIFTANMFVEISAKDKGIETHTGEHYIVICDLKRKKILRHFLIPAKIIEKITIIE